MLHPQAKKKKCCILKDEYYCWKSGELQVLPIIYNLNSDTYKKKNII